MFKTKLLATALSAAMAFVVVPQPAYSQDGDDGPYDSSSMNGNLHNQCTDFDATAVSGTELTISAECNAAGGSAVRATTFDLSGDIVWDTDDAVYTWDGQVNAAENVHDIAEKCGDVAHITPNATDVVLGVRCATIASGAPDTMLVDLPLNGNLQVGGDGRLGRR